MAPSCSRIGASGKPPTQRIAQAPRLMTSSMTATGGIVKMQTGTVKTFNSERGFGFIARDTGGADIFFHVDQVDESIEELFRGQRVSFEEGLNPRNGRPEARDVKIVQWLSSLC